MKIIVFSDSHGYGDFMLHAIGFEEPDAVIFCGDGAGDFKKLNLTSIPVYAVKGNSDYAYKSPEKLTVTLSNKRIFITHGHLYRVKFMYDPVIYAAEEAQADLLCFGHTHVQYRDSIRGLHILNPGAVMNGHYGIVEITDNGQINTKLIKN